MPVPILWRLHEDLPQPDLAVILTAAEPTVTNRVRQRGPHSRWQTRPGTAAQEAAVYRLVRDHLQQEGWPVVTVDTTSISAADAATEIIAEVSGVRRPRAPR